MPSGLPSTSVVDSTEPSVPGVDPDPGPGENAPVERRPEKLRTSRSWIEPTGLVVLVLLLCGLHIVRATEISILDEFTHADYAQRLSELDVPALGSRVGQSMLEEDACRGHQLIDVVPPCGGPYVPDEFPGGGYNNSVAHPPLYFAVVGFGARVVLLAPGIDSFVTAGRLISAAVLASGCLALYWLFGLLRVDRRVRFGVALLPALMPLVMGAGSSINPDVTGILMGALVPASLLAVRQGRLPSWVLIVVSAVLGLTKANNLLVLGVAAAMVVGWLARRELSSRQAAGTLVRMIVPAVSLSVLWTLVVSTRDVRPPGGTPNERAYLVDVLEADQIWANVAAMFPPARGILVDHFAVNPWLTWATLAGWILIGSTFLALFHPTWTVRWIGGGALGAALLGGPALVVYIFSSSSQYFDIPARYGIVLVPAMLVGLACSLRGRWGRVTSWALPAIGITSFLIAFAPVRP